MPILPVDKQIGSMIQKHNKLLFWILGLAHRRMSLFSQIKLHLWQFNAVLELSFSGSWLDSSCKNKVSINFECSIVHKYVRLRQLPELRCHQIEVLDRQRNVLRNAVRQPWRTYFDQIGLTCQWWTLIDKNLSHVHVSTDEDGVWHTVIAKCFIYARLIGPRECLNEHKRRFVGKNLDACSDHGQIGVPLNTSL